MKTFKMVIFLAVIAIVSAIIAGAGVTALFTQRDAARMESRNLKSKCNDQRLAIEALEIQVDKMEVISNAMQVQIDQLSGNNWDLRTWGMRVLNHVDEVHHDLDLMRMPGFCQLVPRPTFINLRSDPWPTEMLKKQPEGVFYIILPQAIITNRF